MSVGEERLAPSRSPRRAVQRLAGDRPGQKWGLIVAWAIVILAFSLLRPETFPTAENWQNMLASQAVLLILALGLIVPLRAGDFDLSVASTLTLSAMLVAKLNTQLDWAVVPAVLAGIGVGVLVGAINGALVVAVRINSFIATLGTATIITGVVQWISGSNVITGVSPTLSEWVVVNRFLGVSLEFWYGVILCFAVWYAFQFTAVGQRLLFVGRNAEVARLSGVKVDKVRWLALIVSGGMAGVAGVVMVGTQGGADPASGAAYLLPAFAAAFLGSTAIIPGRFNVWGTFLAVYFLVTGITGLQLMGVENFVQALFYGSALIIAVAAAQLAGRNAGKGDAAR
jgi:ribose transport system permease protein